MKYSLKSRVRLFNIIFHLQKINAKLMLNL